MRKNPEFEELFDDDFEVTYEEYVPNEYRSSNDIYNDYDDDDDYYDDDYYDDDYEDEYYESDDENSDYDHTDPDDRTKKKKRRKNSKIPLAAPIRKGGRILSNISASLIRSLTALLILAVMIFASWTFLRASAPYGDIMEAVNTKTVPLSLAAYLSVALIFSFKRIYCTSLVYDESKSSRSMGSSQRRYRQRTEFFLTCISHLLCCILDQSVSSRNSGYHLWTKGRT